MKQMQLDMTSPQMFALLQATKLNEESNMITIYNCHQNTAQEVFDAVAIHLLSQNAQSLDSTGTKCQYHGIGNIACSIGSRIPKTHNFSDLENMSLEEIFGDPKHTHVNLLRALQYVHDSDTEYNPISDWKNELIDLARRLNLNDEAIKLYPF